MSKRRDKTPNLLDQITGAQQDKAPAAGKSKRRDEVSGKSKATYYISDSVLADLERYWMDERRRALDEGREPLSKSQIVELALTHLLPQE